MATALKAERLVGDLIDHAIARPGCAVAHDVMEALDGSGGNVDHVVMTPKGIWVVETKSGWLDKRRFPEALGQVAKNTRRVRRHLDTSLPVRGALIIADRWDRVLEDDHDSRGEPVKAFGAKAFWRVLRRECGDDTAIGQSPDPETVTRMVWDLGSAQASWCVTGRNSMCDGAVEQD